jgi:hypothetical protein
MDFQVDSNMVEDAGMASETMAEVAELEKQLAAARAKMQQTHKVRHNFSYKLTLLMLLPQCKSMGSVVGDPPGAANREGQMTNMVTSEWVVLDSHQHKKRKTVEKGLPTISAMRAIKEQ